MPNPIDTISLYGSQVKLLFASKSDHPCRGYTSCHADLHPVCLVPCNSRASHTLAMCITRRIPCHFLSSICIVTAVALLVLHSIHHRQRRNIRLAHSPGTICSAVALSWHSGFGELLMPYDNEAQFSRKLAPLRFSLDPRTGAIVVDDSAIAEAGELAAKMALVDETTPALVEKSRRPL